ncbi:MAG: hypothetical protein RLZZ428_105 [Pseudomonadota bacterium]
MMKQLTRLKNFFYKPLSLELTITSNNGFHLRPAAQFTTLAKSSAAKIKAHAKGKSVDATNVTALLSLSLEKGETFIVTIQGKDAYNIREALHHLFQNLMKNDTQIEKIQTTAAIYEGETLQAESLTKGVAIAPIYLPQTHQIKHENHHSFEEALSLSIKELEILAQKSLQPDIYLAQKTLLSTLGNTNKSFETFQAALIAASEKLTGTKLETKQQDYADLLRRVQKNLGIQTITTYPENPFILVVDDLLPSEVDTLQQTPIAGVILTKGSLYSHAAILLRAANIPTLSINRDFSPNTTVILDASSGVIVTHPTSNDLHNAQQKLQKITLQDQKNASKRFETAMTKEGKSIHVFANVEDTKSALLAKQEGAEGIGLLRTEFLFTEKSPSLAMQQNAYEEIFSLFDEVTIRTLDIGGDKALPYIQLPHENNPFLGVRGVRLLRTHPEIIQAQLHAMFLAAKTKSIKIMFPMISNVEEFIQAKALAQNIAQKHGIDISHHQFGIMVEVPSVLFLIPSFNEVVDFYSIGSNDLSQYLFATERTHPTLKIDPLSPVIFDAIAMIMKQATKPVSICGELAANTPAISKLVNLGLTTLSVTPKSVPQTKEEIRHV